MKWEHKIGIVITCTFLCLVGAVLGLKMQEQPSSGSPKVAAVDPVESAPPKNEKKNPIAFHDNDMSFSNVPEPPEVRSPLPNRKDTSSKDKLPATPEPPPGTPGPSPSPSSTMMDGADAKNKQVKDKTNAAIGPTLSPSAMGEPSPTLPQVDGASEWSRSPSG